MPALLIRQKAADATIWKPLFAPGSSTLRANGCTGGQFFRNTADPDEVWILLEWDDLFRARLFVQSDDMSNALARAGAVDLPDVWFLEDGDRTGSLDEPARVLEGDHDGRQSR